VLQFLGEDGYVAKMRETMDAVERLQAGIAAIDGVHVWGEPDGTVLAIGSHTSDIFAIGDAMNAKRWHFDRQDMPPALHLMASPRHKLVIDEFLADLRDAAANNAGVSTTAAAYGDDVSAEAKVR
jgi:glutamate/tyrosine decarboxylase-like PLP-dependent enzyme